MLRAIKTRGTQKPALSRTLRSVEELPIFASKRQMLRHNEVYPYAQFLSREKRPRHSGFWEAYQTMLDFDEAPGKLTICLYR